MIVVKPSRSLEEKRGWIINLAFLALGVIFVFTLLFSLSTSLEEDVEMKPLGKVQKQGRYEEIGLGPLALNGMRTQGPVPSLAKELMIAGRNDRPDAKLADTPILLSLKSTHQERVVRSGETIYLSSQPNGTFLFSNDKTALAIQPMAMEGAVIVDVALGEKRGEFILRDLGKTDSRLENEPYVKSLKEAKGWGQDLLIQNYGGDEYQVLQGKWKVDFGKSVCFVGPGDFLTWEEDCWHPTSADTTMPFLPLARVKSVSLREISIEAWDPTGFYPIMINIPLQQSPRNPLKLEEVITSVRPRAGSELTCVLGKRRVVVKEGDWWLRMESGWRNLRTIGDIEDFLYHRLRGELFIFDTVATEKGKAILRGHYFDAMRTQMMPLVLTVSTEKKGALASRRKEMPSGPMMAVKAPEEKIKHSQPPQYQVAEQEDRVER